MTVKRNSNKPIPRRSGFTLVELLVVMFIIGMLATIAVPTVSEYLRVAKQQTSLTVLGQIQGACGLYKSDFDEYPPSALSGPYANWQGGELLTLFLTGYGPDKDNDGLPGSNMATDDGHEGFGFRVQRRGRVFPAYNGLEKANMGRGNNGRPYFVDAWDNPICYYRYDDDAYNVAQNRGGSGNGPSSIAYARDDGGKYYRKDIWLCSRGNNGEWNAPSDSGDNDDVTNFFLK